MSKSFIFDHATNACTVPAGSISMTKLSDGARMFVDLCVDNSAGSDDHPLFLPDINGVANFVFPESILAHQYVL